MTDLTSIEKGVVATLAYFDIFDYPLRLKELVRWFYPQEPMAGVRRDQVEKVIRESERLRDYMDVKDGWYCLRGRDHLIATRAKRLKMAKGKWRIAKFAAGLLGAVPFLRMVAVCNRLALNNVREDSDIDFFLVSRNSRLWTMRFFATALLDFSRIRRKGFSIKNKICLSFYVTRDALNLEPLSFQPTDPHFFFWADQFVLLFGPDEFERYRTANAWINKHLPFVLSESQQPLVRPTPLARALRSGAEWILGGSFGNWVDDYLKGKQKARMSRNLSSVAREDNTKVVISDDVLKFHEQDRREEYRRKFEARFWEVMRQPETAGENTTGRGLSG